MNEVKKFSFKGKGRKAALTAVAALLLAAFGAGLHFGGAGLGFGGSGSNGGTASQRQTQTEESSSMSSVAAVTAAPVTLKPAYEIVISEKSIIFNGKECTLKSLREALLSEYNGIEPCQLVDRHAIKSVYDACKATLDDLQISYVEK